VSTFVCHVAGSTFLCQGIQSKVKFRNYDCHYKLIDPNEIPVSELIKDILPMVLAIRISERMSLIIRKCSHFQRPDALPEHPFSLPVSRSLHTCVLVVFLTG
jgi:hypothetical protein